MPAANLKVVTAAQMTALEHESERQGASTDTLMENAGLAVAEYARQRLGGVAGARVIILVGPGNNGADGLVAGRHLRRWGAEVTACLLTRRPEVDPKMDLARDYGVATLNLAAGEGMAAYERLLARSHLVIDSVLGTGRSRALQGVVQEALLQVAAIREGSGHPLLLALDVPTGLDSDTGAVDDATPAMDATLVLGFPKAGLLSFPGAGRVGELVTLDIGLPNGVGQDDIALELLTPEWVASQLPPRPLDSHKGTYGHLLVVAGSRNYVGAACLVARAAHRAGAGLVTLATPKSVYPIVAAQLTETIHLPLPEDEDGRVHPDAAHMVREVLPRYDALAVGSGMGQSDGVSGFMESLLLAAPFLNLPVLVDADGLNSLPRLGSWWQQRSGPLVLTPHPGEMATLTGLSTPDVQRDRVGVAREWAAQWQAVVVLKGAFTAIAEPVLPHTSGPQRDGLVRLSPFADPGLASGGTGDVLTGITGSLLAQGMDPFDAASCAVYLHGLAAELATNGRGPVGLLASEVADSVPGAIGAVIQPRRSGNYSEGNRP
ncbi:MAG: NAD(P)H-hydrate dehydratase [Chloroflexota bacterium]|nr:NAD(P)H-hydrate dehydratase [Chloroflexota bacterium]